MSAYVPARGARARARTHAVTACAAVLACALAAVLVVLALAGERLAFARGSCAARGRTTRVASREDAASVRAVRAKSALVALDRELVAFPPAAEAGVPVVYLHGVNGKPENGCPWMRGASGWVLCPRGDVATAFGTATWSGARSDAAIARSLAAAHETGSPVVVGFSQGAYEIAALVAKGRLRARGVVLLGADVRPEASALRAAGVLRVVLGGGEDDPTFPALRAHVARLAAAGVEVRLVSLGRVGHMYVASDPEALREAIRWAAGRDDEPRGPWSGLT